MLAVISGGSQGLGFAMAEEYVSKDWDVILVARTESKLQDAVSKLHKKAQYIVADVSIAEDCTRVFATLDRTPDLVICCAGSALPGMFMEMSTEELAKNLKSVYDTALYFSHAALKVMAAAPDKHLKRRRIVYCSSSVAVFPLIGFAAYAPAKAAVRSLADIVRLECLEHNIDVCHVMPGSMDTEGFAIEELTKPAITRKIEGASFPLPPRTVAKQVVRDLENGHQTIFTDTIGWILGSSMMGTSPRAGLGLLQTIVGLLLILFAPLIRLVLNGYIRREGSGRDKRLTLSPGSI